MLKIIETRGSGKTAQLLRYKEILTNSKKFKCHKCGHEYLAEAKPQWDENYCFTYWESNCPKCNNLNEINDCYWR